MKVAPLIIFLTGIYLAEGKPTTNPNDLEASGFKRLFDGKTLKGWEGNPDYFRIEDGAIVAGNLEKKSPTMNFWSLRSPTETSSCISKLASSAKAITQVSSSGVSAYLTTMK